MGITESYLTILSDSLDKKIAVLEQLDGLNASQSELIKAGKFDTDEFQGLSAEKDNCIASIVKLDEGFQILYDKVRGELQDNMIVYGAKIKELQGKISRITELNNHVQVAERRNYDAIKGQIQGIRDNISQTRKSQKTVASYYKTANYAAEPVFMDKKK